MPNYTPSDHTFVICAYGKSEYLESCIRSIKAQTVFSKIIISTSTPNDSISSLSLKYHIPVYNNSSSSGIGSDWNFAISCSSTSLTTIAHQDDLYEPEYTNYMLNEINHSSQPLLFFSDYYELRGDRCVYHNTFLLIKRLMLLPVSIFPSFKWVRKSVLAFGNPFCCPSMTYITESILLHPFSETMKSNLDWAQTAYLSNLTGDFVYCKHPLMCHRIHSQSATSNVIIANQRRFEDYQVLKLFWHEPFAAFISRIYSVSERFY